MFSTSDLAQFTGSENVYFNPLFKQFQYTEGVKFVSDNGCAWLVIDILAHLQTNRQLREEGFLVFKMNKAEKKLTIEDGDYNVLASQDYICCDLPVDEVVIWFANGTLLLPSEY